MKQNKKQTVTGVLLLMLLIVAMTGCGKKETPTTTAMKQETTKEETTASSGKTESKGKYTIDEIAQDVKFDGKKISFPTTLKKLGDEYCWGKDHTPLERDGYYAECIYYKDKAMNKGEDFYIILSTAWIKLGESEELTEDSLICGMLICDGDLNIDKFSVKGIKVGDSLEQVRQVLGTEDYTKQEGVFTCYSYGSENENHVDFNFKDGDFSKIYSIRIVYEK